MPKLRLILLISASLSLAACRGNDAVPRLENSKDGVEIVDARLVLPIVSGGPGAAYFTVNNGTDAPISIVTVEVAASDMAMMHETLQTGGHSAMQMLGKVDVPAHQSVAFAPGGKHVMVTGMSPNLKANTMTYLTLTYGDGDKSRTELPVVPPAAAGGQ
ncbi:MAG: copper chaperone PCu(A)C [Novosphingobium sp.]